MKIFSSLLIASTLFTMSFTGGATPEVNHRPYISTRLAKVIMSEDEEVIEEKCDGSGWITHGDGHKTECPGCSACQDKIKPEPDPDIKPSSVCQCGCEREGCNCQQTGKCFPLPEQEPLKKKRLKFLPRIFELFRGRTRVQHLPLRGEMVCPLRTDEETDLGQFEGQKSDRRYGSQAFYL